MYTLDRRTPAIQRVVSRTERLARSARNNTFRPVLPLVVQAMPFEATKELCKIPLRGKEQRIADNARHIAAKALGVEEVIGSGSETMVVRVGQRVVKYACFVRVDPLVAMQELRRRHEVVSLYLGDFVVETQVDVGVLETKSQPTAIVMEQPYSPISEATEAHGVIDQIAHFCDRAEKMFDEAGLVVDVYPGSGNIGVTNDGRILLVDTSVFSIGDHGNTTMLNRYGTVCDINIPLRQLTALRESTAVPLGND